MIKKRYISKVPNSGTPEIEDHKPTEEDEARRIFKKGGRIKPYIDEETGEEMGPQRVWLKDDEVAGLAMTRSLEIG